MAYPNLFLCSDNLYECSPDMDEEEIAQMKEQGAKSLAEAGLTDGTLVRAEDEFQDLAIDILLTHREQPDDVTEAKEGEDTATPLFVITKGAASSGNVPEATEETSPVAFKRKRPEEDDEPSQPPFKSQKL